MYLNVLNRSEKTDIGARIDSVAGQIASQAAVWEMNHSDLKATNDFGSEKVRPTITTVTLALTNNGFTYSFPKHSLTILRLELSAAPAVSAGKLAARPLYRDPPFDNPTDPVLTYNAETRRWFMYYTQRRGGGIALIHGSRIGMAASETMAPPGNTSAPPISPMARTSTLPITPTGPLNPSGLLTCTTCFFPMSRASSPTGTTPANRPSYQ